MSWSGKARRGFEKFAEGGGEEIPVIGQIFGIVDSALRISHQHKVLQPPSQVFQPGA